MKSGMILLCIDGMRYDYLDDSGIKIHNLRSLREKGSVVSRLTSIYPTITWAANTSVVTGCHPSKHGVLGNEVYERGQRRMYYHFGDRTWSKEEVVKVPTIYDLLAKRGEHTASICWPVTRGAQNIKYNIPEFYEQELFEQYSTQTFWNELKALKLPVERYGEWSADHAKGAKQDWLTNEILQYVIAEKRPRLTMVHYLLIDSYLHDYGNRTPEVYWGMEYVDMLLGETLRVLKKTGKLETTDLIIYSDHGHADIHSAFYPNKLLTEKGWHNPQHLDECKFTAVSNGGCTFLYQLEYDEALLHEAEVYFRTLPYIKKVLIGDGIVEANIAESINLSKGHCPDIILELSRGYISEDRADAESVIVPTCVRSAHGFGADDPEMDGFMIAVGPSFQSGFQIERAGLIDIAPTMARIFGIQLPDADGAPLTSMLK